MRIFNKNPAPTLPNYAFNTRKDKKSYYFIQMLRVQGIIFARPPFFVCHWTAFVILLLWQYPVLPETGKKRYA